MRERVSGFVDNGFLLFHPQDLERNTQRVAIVSKPSKITVWNCGEIGMPKKILIVGALIIAVIVSLRLMPSNPGIKITSMCESYYGMITRKVEGVDISKADREDACEASWASIESVMSTEDLEIYKKYTFRIGKPGAMTSEVRQAQSQIRHLAFEGSCEWAKSAGKPRIDREVFCGPLQNYAMY